MLVFKSSLILLLDSARVFGPAQMCWLMLR
jgi:hypothetical protein